MCAAQNMLHPLRTWTRSIAGRDFTIETGRVAKQADGAVMVRCGDTQVLATAVMSKNKSGVMGYFPLMVDYEERYYAAGRLVVLALSSVKVVQVMMLF